MVTDALVLDFSEAFDRVAHQRLLYKLSHYGINGNMLSWIGMFPTQRTQKVILEGIASNRCDAISSVSSRYCAGTAAFPIVH